MSKSFKPSSSSPLSDFSDSKGGCGSIDPKDESLKSRTKMSKEMDEENPEEEF